MIETETKTTELAPLPEAEDIVPFDEVRDFELWARLKKTSKYFHQGLVDPTNSKSEVRFFKVDHFTPAYGFGLKLGLDRDSLRFNRNNYRLEDVELYLRDAKNPKLFLRIR